MADVKRITVVIYGEEYQLRSDLPEESVQALARVVDSRIRVLATRHPRVPASRLAVLASMTFAEELMRLTAEHEETLKALQAQWRRSHQASRRKQAGSDPR